MIESRLLHTIPLHALSGVSPSLIKKLSQLKLKTLQDLLLHLPIRYEDRTKVYSISNVFPGMFVTVKGQILSSNVSLGRKRILICRLQDCSGILTLRFFNFNMAVKNTLISGKWVTVYGEIRRGQRYYEIIHPEYHIKETGDQAILTSSLTPIYPTIKGIHQKTLRFIITQSLKLLEIIPIDEIFTPITHLNLMSLSDALHILHRPDKNISLKDLAYRCHPAQRRLIFEELLAYDLSILTARSEAKKNKTLPIRTNISLIQRFLDSLPFSLSISQNRVVKEIKQDLSRNVPMMRLVQGDVGSGKTIVAAMAALLTISDSRQVALMVPTELLAEQHAQNFSDWFSPLGIKVSCLFGRQNIRERQKQQEIIASGQSKIVIGTHAIFQKKIQFSELSLIIIDEQHRFGVHQRLTLWEKGLTQGFYPHQLIMTATPIPRTLAMTVYAHLDISIIDDFSPKRTPVTTLVISDTRRKEVIDRIKETCLKEKRQVYWVCTLIEESDFLIAQTAKAIWLKLKESLFELKIGLIHGRMKKQEKQKVMLSFKKGEIQLLVATTVIEVGIDVSNASLMVIENPERLGLSQLHQLRGRIGRGIVQSYCILLYKAPLNESTHQRLKILRNSNDGFFISQSDMEIRGFGELLGTRQAGKSTFHVADLLQDQEMIPEVQKLSRYIYKNFPYLGQALIKRWISQCIHHTNA